MIENTAITKKIKDHAPDALESENTATVNNAERVMEAIPTDSMPMREINTHGIFLPGDVVGAFNAEYLVESFCRYWVIEHLHPRKMFSCPECGTAVPENLVRSFWEAKRIECGQCGKWFTALTGTFLSGCHMNFQEIVLFALLIGLGVQDKEVARIMKISVESVRLWRLKFKELEKIKS